MDKLHLVLPFLNHAISFHMEVYRTIQAQQSIIVIIMQSNTFDGPNTSPLHYNGKEKAIYNHWNYGVTNVTSCTRYKDFNTHLERYRRIRKILEK